MVDAVPCLVRSENAFCPSSLKAFLFNEEFSDVTFIVGDVKIPAHKIILGASSEYFRALLGGGLRESQEREVNLDVANEQTARLFLRYVYTGELDLQDVSFEINLDLLEAAHKFQVINLQDELVDEVGHKLKVENVLEVYRVSELLLLKRLKYRCLYYMDYHAKRFLNDASFLTLSQEELRLLFRRDTMDASETTKHLSVMKWMDAANVADKNTVLRELNAVFRYIPDSFRWTDCVVLSQILSYTRQNNVFYQPICFSENVPGIVLDMKTIVYVTGVIMEFEERTLCGVETGSDEEDCWRKVCERKVVEGRAEFKFRARAARYVRIYFEKGGIEKNSFRITFK